MTDDLNIDEDKRNKGDSYSQKGNHGIGHMDGGVIKDKAQIIGESRNNEVNINLNQGASSKDSNRRPLEAKYINKDEEIEIKAPDIETFKEMLSLLRCYDPSLGVQDIEKSSIKFILKGSEEGLKSIAKSFESGALAPLLKQQFNLELEDAKLIDSDSSENYRINQSQKLLAFTIAGDVSQADIDLLKDALIDTSDDEEIEETRTEDRNLISLCLKDAKVCFVKIFGITLFGFGLSDADLRGAHLNRANLSHVNLFRANLSDADLSNADLSDADLSDADLRGAYLRSADLRSANLRSADLRSANLSNANLSRANLSDADLRGADLKGADLSDADLSDADLSDADLRGAYLRSSDLRSANLRGADLRGANLRGADLSHADLSGADLSGVNLNGVNLNGVRLVQSNLTDSQLNNANLIRANLIGANLINAQLIAANLTDADFSGAKVENTRFAYNLGISENLERDLISRGAIFIDDPPLGDRSGVLAPV